MLPAAFPAFRRPRPAPPFRAGTRRSRHGISVSLLSPAGPRPLSARLGPRQWEPRESGFPPPAPSVFPLPSPGAGSNCPRTSGSRPCTGCLFRSDSKSSMDCPSAPGAPPFAFTFCQASHTSCFGIANGLPAGFCSPTRLLQDCAVDRSDEPRMSRPLRSAPTAQAGVSPLLRAGPPARPATVLSPLRFRRLGFSLSPPLKARPYRGALSHVPHESRRPGSRHLHAGHHLASRRVSARLIPGQNNTRFRCRLIQ